jgi:hypothetical protein
LAGIWEDVLEDDVFKGKFQKIIFGFAPPRGGGEENSRAGEFNNALNCIRDRKAESAQVFLCWIALLFGSLTRLQREP